jgi:diguanylate cyclase (GGDEF)-like protein
VVWWIFYELFQTIALASLFYFELRPAALPESGLASWPGSLVVLGMGIMALVMLVCGFRDAFGKPVTAGQLQIGGTTLAVILLLTGFGTISKAIYTPQTAVLSIQILSGLAFLYVAAPGLFNRKTSVLAAGCTLSLLTAGLRVTGILVATFGHHFTGAVQSIPMIYAGILLLQSASSGLVTLGMIWLVTEMHRTLVAKLCDAMGELRRCNDQLERVAGIDPLTEIANRRSFDRDLATRWRRALRSGSETVSLLMADVDHFKTLNDTMGHPAGDRYLKQLASILQEIFRRDEDLAARIGGEEFAILLTGVGPDASLQLAEKARGAVEEALGELCTVSVGCATVPPPESAPESLIQTADKAQYLAKEGGRNRVVSIPASATEQTQRTGLLTPRIIDLAMHA